MSFIYKFKTHKLEQTQLSILYRTFLLAMSICLFGKVGLANHEQSPALQVTVIYSEKHGDDYLYSVLACAPDQLSLDPISCSQGGTLFLNKVDTQKFKEEILLRAEFGKIDPTVQSDIAFALEEYISLRPHTRLRSFENILQIKEREFKTLSHNIRTTLEGKVDHETYNKSSVVKKLNRLQQEIIDLENQRDRRSQSLTMISNTLDTLMLGIQEQPIVYLPLPVENHDHELSYKSYFVSLFKTSLLQSASVEKEKEVLKPFAFREGLSWVKSGSSYGLVDKLGNWRIPLTQDIVAMSSFSDGLGIVQRKNGKVQFIDLNGLIPSDLDLEFSRLHSFENGIAAVTLKSGKSGLLGINGEFLSAYGPVYDKLEFGSNTRNAFQLGNQLGYILPNLEKQVVPASNFESIYAIKQNYGIFLGPKKDDPSLIVYHQINLQNRIIFASDYLGDLNSPSKVVPFDKKSIRIESTTWSYPGQIVSINGETGYYIWDQNLSHIDRSTNFLEYKPPPIYRSTHELDSTVIPIKLKDGKWYYNSFKSGVQNGPYHFAAAFSEGKAHVVAEEPNGLYRNFINHHGEYVFPKLRFQDLGAFGNGLAYAKTESQSGFLNESGDFEIFFKD
jgi:hypothetical protein